MFTLEEGLTYTIIITVRNTSTKFGQPVAAQLRVATKVTIAGNELVSDVQVPYFQPSEPKDLQVEVTVPAGAGSIDVVVSTPDGGIPLKTAHADIEVTAAFPVVFLAAQLKDFYYTAQYLAAWGLWVYSGAIHASWTFNAARRIDNGTITAYLTLQRGSTVLVNRGQINSTGGLAQGGMYYYPEGQHIGSWPYVGWPLGGDILPQTAGEELTWVMEIVAGGVLNGVSNSVVGQATFTGTVRNLGV